MSLHAPLQVVDFTKGDKAPTPKKKSKYNKKSKIRASQIPVGDNVKRRKHQEEDSDEEMVDSRHMNIETMGGAELSDDDVSVSSNIKHGAFADAVSNLLGDDSGDGQILSEAMAKKKAKDEAHKHAMAKHKMEILQRRLLQNRHHKVPDFSNHAAEVSLKKTATRGVVKLFTVIRKKQKELEEENEAPGFREKTAQTAALSKEAFLNLLKGNKSGLSAENAKKTLQGDISSPVAPNKPTWKVLSDQFMMDDKQAHWNSEDEDEDEGDFEEEMD